ncbi:MAG: IclR family transcriptional regulator [Ancalomicrobiaceae bacterium]|nr:IclR family transcriptional regulator [Ancalomicrobiaceae bacterium]
MNVIMESTSDAPALDRGLSVLEYVVEAGHPVSMKEISTAMSIPSASAFRLVKTLVQRGYLEETNRSPQFYLPGNKVFQMVQFYQLNHSLHSVARMPLRDLAERTGQTAQLAILKGTSVMYIEQAMPKEPVSIVAPLHSFIPINVSAAGKILCSYLSDDELMAFLSPDNLTKKTKNTISDSETLVATIKASRKQGYATDIEEFARGIGCVAGAIWDSHNRCVGALGVTGHVDQYRNKASLDHIVQSVLALAEDVSHLMGYAEQYPRP